MKEVITKCPLCQSTPQLRYEGMKGYIEDSFYDIYECSQCNTSFVNPQVCDETIYDYIYKQVKFVPGYERYYRYANLVKKFRDPFRFMSNSEGLYWAVREALEKYFPQKKDIEILEIGSGLGYLTYSLNVSGYKTVGLDIAEDAIIQARNDYGDYYEVGDLFKLAAKAEKKYDCVLMLEVIEHVEQPTAFIQAALALLKEGGKLIVTTPNKSAAPKDSIWQSDIPPVHLWFFSEDSLMYIAKSLNRSCEFVDFTNFTKKFYGPQYVAGIEEIQAGLPRLTKDGTVRPGTEASHLKTAFFGLKGRYYLSYIRRRFKKKTISKRSTTQCAIIS